jgi:signal transduction histidine kinase
METIPLSTAADAELLQQVWVNLVHNAIKFTPAGGSISVTLTQAGNEACVCISDSGIGIESGELLHIYERFYKGDRARDRSRGGNGLGLALARRIVELHAGSINVQSQPGAGSSFTVLLPL